MPFLIYGGTALGTGRGEAVSPVLARATSWHWVVAVADGGIATPAAYAELDRLRETGAAGAPLGSTDALFAALRQRDPRLLAAALGNDLQDAALAMRRPGATLKAGGGRQPWPARSGRSHCVSRHRRDRRRPHRTELETAGVCREARVAHGTVLGAAVG